MIRFSVAEPPAEAAGILPGLTALQEDFGFRLASPAEADLLLEPEHTPEPVLELLCRDGRVRIRYDFSKKSRFFRALSLILEQLSAGKTEFELHEAVFFPTMGTMFDLCQGNFALNIPFFQSVLRRMAVMGMNICMLYCEDTIAVPEEPYCGYMRARYSYDELKALDDYADALGIELVPAVQTLAHLHDVLKWDVYRQIREDDDCMVPEDEATYTFVRHMLTAASAPFRSRRIHIGMDEAMGLGRGTYLDRNGCVPREEIMRRHLKRVLEITKELDLEPILFSDMFGGSNSADLDARPDPAEFIPDVFFHFWNYYKTDPEWYRRQLQWHKKLGRVIFAGGIWTWKGFGPNWARTLATTKAALDACREEGISEIIATTWGDSGTESDFRLNLWGMQLFAEYAFHAEVTPELHRRRLLTCTGLSYDDLMLLQQLDEVPGVEPGNPRSRNPSKFLLWQDPLTGLFDNNIRGVGIRAHYEALEPKLAAAVHPGPGEDVFRLYHLLVQCLCLKSELGIQLYDAYHAHDAAALARLEQKTIPELLRLVRLLRAQQMRCWMQTCKMLGWEILDMRYGSLLTRLETAAERLRQYRTGEADRIEELEEVRLPFNGEPGIPRGRDTNSYGRIVSAGRIAPEAFLLKPL